MFTHLIQLYVFIFNCHLKFLVMNTRFIKILLLVNNSDGQWHKNNLIVQAYWNTKYINLVLISNSLFQNSVSQTSDKCIKSCYHAFDASLLVVRNKPILYLLFKAKKIHTKTNLLLLLLLICIFRLIKCVYLFHTCVMSSNFN